MRSPMRSRTREYDHLATKYAAILGVGLIEMESDPRLESAPEMESAIKVNLTLGEWTMVKAV